MNKNALAVVRNSFYNYFIFNEATIENIESLTQPSVSISLTNQIHWKCVTNLNTIEEKYLFQQNLYDSFNFYINVIICIEIYLLSCD